MTNTIGSEFGDWKRFVVRQRRAFGCIPTGYEMLLRMAGLEGVDLDSFQDDFDLDQDLRPGIAARNNFESVAEAVRSKYPHISFRSRAFPVGDGAAKLAFIEDRIVQRQPILVSIALEGLNKGGGWHIMPVVDATADTLDLFAGIDPEGTLVVWQIPKNKLVLIHDTFRGGKDVAYFESLPG